MSRENPNVKGSQEPLTSPGLSVGIYLLRLLGLAILDSFALWFLYHLYQDQVWFMFVVILVITMGINLVFLIERLHPFRWMSAGLSLMILLVIYPLGFTIYNAFTNYNQTHLLSKPQAVGALENEKYLPGDAPVYSWTAFRSTEGSFALWLISPDGETFLTIPGEPLQQPRSGEAGVGMLDDKGIPTTLNGYIRLSRADSVKYLTELTNLQFGIEPEVIVVMSISKAARYEQKYTYNPELDQLLDNETGVIYRPVDGNFTSPSGEQLTPGFHITVGWRNFSKLFRSPALRGPLLIVFVWTLTFSLLSVLFSFSFGLILALSLHRSLLPNWTKKSIRSVLLLPFIIPFFLSVLIWRGMLNPNIGIVDRFTEYLFHWSIPWFTDPFWAKTGIILINVWLSYPYMMMISMGALQSIPEDLYEVAELDGATSWQQFWGITLPLLLISVGPLLVFSFAGSFNNFGLIYLYNYGGPPIPNTITPAGYTDILISYVYNTAFTGNGNYSYASTVTIVIFLILTIFTLLQFKYTRIWEEVYKNV
ncbi:MAG: ABC transporter permease subunit [Chloroflexi bacterium]|nr:ABC transporter permease subunit [Chloroflexota bacterium]